MSQRVKATDLSADLTDNSATALSAMIRDRHASCREVMQAFLERVATYNPVYNAIVNLIDEDAALSLAREADEELAQGRRQGWLHGLPFAVKDTADAQGFPTTYGSPIMAQNLAPADEPAIARIRAHGALFIGKTNVPEWGLGSQTYNTLFGVTGSACDPELTAGGSSGGAAAALGTRMLPVADGSDFMGSLRNPAAYNNVIGFRPSQGRVPGPMKGDLYDHQLVVSGPMARNAEDAYRLLLTMHGPTPEPPLSQRDLAPADAFEPLELKDLKIGWLGDHDGYLPMEPGILALCESNFAGLRSAGAIVEDCAVQFDMDRLWRAFLTLRQWTLFNSLKPLYAEPSLRAALKEEAIWEAERGAALSGEAIHDAGAVRAEWRRRLRVLFAQYDVVLSPSAQVFPFAKDRPWPSEVGGRAMDAYHRWMEVVIGGTMAGAPVVSVPAGFDEKGRPMGLQAMTPFGADRAALQFAAAYERVTDHLDRDIALIKP